MQHNELQCKTEERLPEGFSGDEALPLDLVCAFAGDRPPTEREAARLDDLKMRRGSGLYSGLLYAITHQHFPPSAAEGLWNEILQHKFELSETLRRNVGIAVAALDYLSNLKGQLKSPTLIGESQVAEIAQRILRDGLTRLFNHTTCIEKLTMEANIHQRYGRPVSVMLIDVDDFKQINDRYGHQAGDRVLAALAATISGATRASDMCCRYGGDEFVVILPTTRASEAAMLAERLGRAAAESQPDGLRVTLSIGVASCEDFPTTAQELLEKADAAMYQAKKAGKNRVAVSG